MKKFVRRKSNLPGITSFLICLFCLGAILTGAAATQTAWQPDARLEAAVLKEDWPQVAKLLDSSKNLSPSARLIKAHAYLALNRNNESLCLFLGADSKDDLGKWEEWSQGFYRKNPQAAIAHYFRGDALARLEKWNLALAAFNTALELRPNHPMALNARGIVQAAGQQWDKALFDFDNATEVNPFFADAYANRGVLYIQRKDGADGALRAFKRALEISPDFILALNGKASLQIVSGEWDAAEASFEETNKRSIACLSIISDIVTFNLGVLSFSKSEAVSKGIAEIAKIGPGMSATRRSEMISKMSPEAAGRLKGLAGGFYIPHNQRVSGLPLDKLGADFKFKSELSGKMVGNVPIVGGKLEIGGGINAKWDIHNRTVNNLRYQNETLDLVNKIHPNVSATKMGPIGTLKAMSEFWKFTHSDAGGVSTASIGDAHVDKGAWDVMTLYGLFYSVGYKESASAGKEKVK